ncbi:lysophospholipid acyltransferase family protein [Halalkalibacter alkalisediminis]|nr:lysophospholipid acyltransferase family protein [Halalkalibacter alkalisediminis]
MQRYYIRLLSKNERLVAKKTDQIAEKLMRNLVQITGSTVEVRGEEHLQTDEPYILIANHQSNFDIPLLLGFVHSGMGFVSKQELRKIPIGSKWMELKRCLFIDRQNPRQAIRDIDQKIEETKLTDDVLCIFPEGTSSKGDQVGEFKTGAFRAAKRKKIAILPVAISGSFQLMEQNNGKISAGHVVLTILPLQKPKEDVKVWAEEVREQIQACTNKPV